MKKLILIVFIAVGVIAGFSFAPHEVSALSCAVSSIQQDIESASAVFVGKVVDLNTSDTYKTNHYATFEVTKYWKNRQVGKTTTVARIYAWNGQTEQSPFFVVGNSYLVFADGLVYPATPYLFNEVRPEFGARIDCNRTKLLSFATEEIAALGPGKVPEDGNSAPEKDGYRFTKNLTIGSTGPDVVALQNKLEAGGFLAMPTGTSKGYFGALTKTAVIKFQTTKNISPAAGFVGPLTRTILNTY